MSEPTDAYGCPLSAIPDMEAEQRLIAAAPDMLKAILTTRCPGGGWNGMPKDIDPTVENCIAHNACGCDLGDAVRQATGAALASSDTKGQRE